MNNIIVIEFKDGTKTNKIAYKSHSQYGMFIQVEELHGATICFNIDVIKSFTICREDEYKENGKD